MELPNFKVKIKMAALIKAAKNFSLPIDAHFNRFR